MIEFSKSLGQKVVNATLNWGYIEGKENNMQEDENFLCNEMYK